MRRSIERRKREQELTIHKAPSFWRRHIIILISIPILIGITAGFILCADLIEQRQATERTTSVSKQAEAITQAVNTLFTNRLTQAKAVEAAVITNQNATIPTPQSLTRTRHCLLSDPMCTLTVVNKKHMLSPASYVPPDFVTVGNATLRSEAQTHFQDLLAAAKQAGFTTLDVSSSYRSYDAQVITFNQWVQTNGSTAAAERVSALPGDSEHQTGFAVDLKLGSCVLECFGTTDAYTWLTEHAAEYGFIHRYPPGLTPITGYDSEAWHWRYISIPYAEDMKTKEVQTLEEYLGVSGGDYAN